VLIPGTAVHLDKQFAPERIIMLGVFFLTLFSHVSYDTNIIAPGDLLSYSCKNFANQDADIPERDASCTSTLVDRLQVLLCLESFPFRFEL
jgi:hypothetical protein